MCLRLYIYHLFTPMTPFPQHLLTKKWDFQIWEITAKKAGFVFIKKKKKERKKENPTEIPQ